MSRGQTLGLSAAFAFFFFIFGIVFINFLQPDIESAQSSLNCSAATTISDGNKIMCLFVDGMMPYFIILVLSSAMGAITSRLTIG